MRDKLAILSGLLALLAAAAVFSYLSETTVPAAPLVSSAQVGAYAG